MQLTVPTRNCVKAKFFRDGSWHHAATSIYAVSKLQTGVRALKDAGIRKFFEGYLSSLLLVIYGCTVTTTFQQELHFASIALVNAPLLQLLTARLYD